MYIRLIAPVPPRSRSGNRATTTRWAAILRALLLRAETDPAFYQSLMSACAGRRHRFTLEGETAAWAALLGEL